MGQGAGAVMGLHSSLCRGTAPREGEGGLWWEWDAVFSSWVTKRRCTIGVREELIIGRGKIMTVLDSGVQEVEARLELGSKG